MLHRYLIAEILKLRRSLALLLCVAAPSCVAGLTLVISLNVEGPPILTKYGMGVSGLWSIAMMPLAVTALSVLVAQMEHGPRSWHHLLTLPGARPHLYLAKALVMLALVTSMAALLWVETLFTGWLIATIRSDAKGAVDGLWMANTLMRITAAAILMAMLQLWVALRFKSFVPPLVFGIAGTVVALAAQSAQKGMYFPWLMSAAMMTSPERQQIALMLGGAGGLIVMLAMLAHMSWREA